MLCIFSYEDIKRKSLPVMWIIIGFVLLIVEKGLVKIFFDKGFSVNEIITVICMFIASFLFQKYEMLGAADMLVVAMTGLLTGFELAVISLLTALFLVSIVGVILLMLRRIKRKDTICFIPFYTIAFWGVVVCV